MLVAGPEYQQLMQRVERAREQGLMAARRPGQVLVPVSARELPPAEARQLSPVQGQLLPLVVRSSAVIAGGAPHAPC